ncbi:MAG: hypothetical protein ABIB71_00700 [Candidatus Woesearchaeota archaeon]
MVFGNTDLTRIIGSLEDFGFYEVALPFLLIFTLIFAVLEKISLFGQNSKNINVIVSLAIAFFTIRVTAVVAMMNAFLPKVSALVLVILMVLLVWGIFGAKGEKMTGGWFFMAMVLSIGGLIWAVVSSLPSLSLSVPRWLRVESGDVWILALLAAIAIGVGYVLGGGKDKNNKTNVFEKLGNAFSSGEFRK